jgi:HEAT repeat protein
MLEQTMKTLSILFFLTVSATAANCQNTNNPVTGATNQPLPELVDKAEAIINGSGLEPRQFGVWLANQTNVDKISGQNSLATHRDLQSRLAEKDCPLDTKLLYAGILASWGDKQGQEFLLEQVRKANSLEDVQDVFWVIGHLDWLHERRVDEGGQPKTIDMHWAETLMLDALQDTRKFESSKKYLSWSETVQSLALDDGVGNFAEHLAKIKSPKLFPLLAGWFKDGKSNTRIICAAFVELGDQRAVSLLLKALTTSADGNDFNGVAYALGEFHCQEAIPILLKHLDDWEIYGALSQYSDPRILPALTNALANLHEEYAISAARLLIIQLEGGDELPKLIALAEDPKYKGEDLLLLVADLKDKRAVPFATKALNTAPELFDRVFAVRILAAIPDSPEAIKSLFDALDINFNAVAAGKDVIEDQNVRVRGEISEDLQKLTGQNFGTDKKLWEAWFARTHSRTKRKRSENIYFSILSLECRLA